VSWCVCDDSVVDKDLYMRIIAEAAITILPLFILKEKAAFCCEILPPFFYYLVTFNRSSYLNFLKIIIYFITK
jgi:hypothetical protein